MAATQDALYPAVDLDLSWSERDLPQRERTRHVHGLHPYLGKFIPQLVETLLRRYFVPGQHVLDPFAGSGTTLVQALESGLDATGVDVAAFNALLMRAKTRRYDLPALRDEIQDVLVRLDSLEPDGGGVPPPYVGQWYAPDAARELLAFRDLLSRYEHAPLLRVVLARAARSSRLTTHFHLDFPRAPQTESYWCHKHRRECTPVLRAAHFLRRYSLDTLARVEEFGQLRDGEAEALVIHGDVRRLELGGPFDGVLTSPPYPGLIDYHEQHRYAYELLGLERLSDLEVGSAARGASRAAVAAYVDAMVDALANVCSGLRVGAPVVIVVNDRRALYETILERAGLRLEDRLRRHVNRRTGRRAGEFYEDVLVARPV